MKKFWPYLLILLLVLPAARFLFGHGYFNMHDDLQFMRVYEMGKCLADGQIPCRWASDMEWGYGQAMFNFYSAFPYYLGALIKTVLSLSIMGTVKALFFISLLGSALGMYLLGKEFWGKWGGVLAAVLYTYAPYHSLDIYVRGALSESFALAILPFLWLSIYLLLKKPKFSNFAATAFAVAALVTTHNVSTLIYAPFTAVWIIFWLTKFRNWKKFVNLVLAGIFGVGLGSFFLLPVLFEQKLTQTGYFTLNYLDYRAHFITLYQLFVSRHWGYGPSIFGPNDDLSFALGWPHWWLMTPLLVMGAYWIRNKTKRTSALLVLISIALFLVATFLTHGRSTPLWNAISLMAIIQFPWRFLGLSIFFLSFAGGAIAILETKWIKIVVVLIIFLTFALNIGFFIPWNYSSKVRDIDKLTGIGWELQRKSATLDYLPKTAQMAPQSPAPDSPEIIQGKGAISNYIVQSNRFSFDADIYENSEVKIPVMYFPGWKIISGTALLSSEPYGPFGVIKISLQKGKYIIQGRFEDTPIRTVGNSLSLVSTLLLLGLFVLKENGKKILWLE